MGCCLSSTASEVPPPSPDSDEPQPLKVPELATTRSAESELLAEPYRRMVLLPQDSGDDIDSMDSFSGFSRCRAGSAHTFERPPKKRLLKPEEQEVRFVLLLLDEGGRWLADVPVAHGLVLGRGCHPLLQGVDRLSIKQVELQLASGDASDDDSGAEDVEGRSSGGSRSSRGPASSAAGRAPTPPVVSVLRRGPNPSFLQRLRANGAGHALPERLEKDAPTTMAAGDVLWLCRAHAPLRLVCLRPAASDMRLAAAKAAAKAAKDGRAARWSEAAAVPPPDAKRRLSAPVRGARGRPQQRLGGLAVAAGPSRLRVRAKRCGVPPRNLQVLSELQGRASSFAQAASPAPVPPPLPRPSPCHHRRRRH